jgi:hypothetical protein
MRGGDIETHGAIKTKVRARASSLPTNPAPSRRLVGDLIVLLVP